jgi:hypothetical protein
MKAVCWRNTYFNSRVTDHWNSLPSDIVEAPSAVSFKSAYFALILRNLVGFVSFFLFVSFFTFAWMVLICKICLLVQYQWHPGHSAIFSNKINNKFSPFHADECLELNSKEVHYRWHSSTCIRFGEEFWPFFLSGVSSPHTWRIAPPSVATISALYTLLSLHSTSSYHCTFWGCWASYSASS